MAWMKIKERSISVKWALDKGRTLMFSGFLVGVLNVNRKSLCLLLVINDTLFTLVVCG